MTELTIKSAKTARGIPLFQRLRHLIAVARSRRELARLDARALADIGVSAKQAATEVNRGFWDVPAHWRT